MRLLIVDDHTQRRRTLRSILARDSDELREAVDGDAGCDSFEALRPEWTIMDLQMPRIGGLEATRRILPMDPHVPVVIVTEHDEPRLGGSAEDAGASAFVTKDRLSFLADFNGIDPNREWALFVSDFGAGSARPPRAMGPSGFRRGSRARTVQASRRSGPRRDVDLEGPARLNPTRASWRSHPPPRRFHGVLLRIGVQESRVDGILLGIP